MGTPRIVCPESEILLQSFKGLSVALRLNRGAGIAPGVEHVRKSGNTLCCVIVESDRPLAAIEFDDHLPRHPPGGHGPSLGRFRDLARQLDRLRTLNLRVYLPCDHPENLAGLRILSSVGIHGCADFRKGGQHHWDALADLATYAVLERTPHAAMEPFAFMVANYPASIALTGGGLSSMIQHFFHLDESGQVALSQAELADGRFVAHNLREIEAPASNFRRSERGLRSWRQFFVDDHPCASCGGWSLCLGSFPQISPPSPGVPNFFWK